MAFEFEIDFDDVVEQFTPSFLRETDPVIRDGDLELDESDDKIIEYILRANPGDYKENPTLGYAVETKLSSAVDTQEEERKIREQLKKDNMKIKAVQIFADNDENYEINVDAEEKA